MSLDASPPTVRRGLGCPRGNGRGICRGRSVPTTAVANKQGRWFGCRAPAPRCQDSGPTQGAGRLRRAHLRLPVLPLLSRCPSDRSGGPSPAGDPGQHRRPRVTGTEQRVQHIVHPIHHGLPIATCTYGGRIGSHVVLIFLGPYVVPNCKHVPNCLALVRTNSEVDLALPGASAALPSAAASNSARSRGELTAARARKRASASDCRFSRKATTGGHSASRRYFSQTTAARYGP